MTEKIEMVKGKDKMNQGQAVELIQRFMSDYQLAKTKMLESKLKALEVANHFGLGKHLLIQMDE